MARQARDTSMIMESLDPTGRGKSDGRCGTKAVLNAFAITFGDRLPTAETY
jgi:putative transposase